MRIDKNTAKLTQYKIDQVQTELEKTKKIVDEITKMRKEIRKNNEEATDILTI